MPTTKTITLYTYDELPTEKAKQKARDWFLEACASDNWWNGVYDDAKQIGLKITSFDVGRSDEIEGEFIEGAFQCAAAIKAEHGTECDTFKTAKAWETAVDAHEENNLHLGGGSDRYNETLDALESEFLRDLLRCYLRTLRDESEYQASDEYLEEGIQGNEYTFRENGEREDV